jgi:acyl-CoA reductase-like NAD-dependent aldehyde dehydrogenase
MESLVTQSVKEGIEVLTGGERTDRKGYFFTPTVMKNVSPCMRIASEFFGPIAAVVMKMYRYYNQYTINRQSYFSRNLSCY